MIATHRRDFNVFTKKALCRVSERFNPAVPEWLYCVASRRADSELLEVWGWARGLFASEPGTVRNHNLPKAPGERFAAEGQNADGGGTR